MRAPLPRARRRTAPLDPAASTIDLHTHSTASDGLLAPDALVAAALARGLQVLAVTDHDSVGGVGPALAAAAGTPLRVIPGIELNTDAGGEEIHVLGYFLDHQQPELLAFLAEQRAARDDRARAMTERLRAAGLPLAYEQVLAQADGGAVGRPHVARALAAAGLVPTARYAFDHWIGVGMPAYVPRNRLTPEGAVARIRAAGGAPALAHPAGLHDLEGRVGRMQQSGMAGLECHYQGYTQPVVAALVSLARRYGLVPTGGSDFHGPGRGKRPPLGSVRVPPETPELLRARAT